MSCRFTSMLNGWLPNHLTRQMRELYWATFIQNLALAMLLLFEPIYLWQQGFSITQILWFFFILYAVYFFILPLGAKFATLKGFENGIAVSTVALVAYYACLYLVAFSWWWIVPAVIFYVLQKTFYWPAFYADFGRYSDLAEEGKEVSALHVALSGVYVIGPLLGGALITYGSWGLMFIVGCSLILASNWFLLHTREQFAPRNFPYLAAYKRLFARENRRSLVGYLGFGEELILLVLWPVFIATIISQYVEIGALVAVSTLVMIVATLYIGKLSDERDKRYVLRFSTVLYFFVWLARLLARTPLGIFFVDSFSRLTKNIVNVPLLALLYERARSRSVMDTVVSFELALIIGKVVTAGLLLIIFSQITSLENVWPVAWLIAAVMTLFYTII